MTSAEQAMVSQLQRLETLGRTQHERRVRAWRRGLRQLELAVVRAIEQQQPSCKAAAVTVAALLEQHFGTNAPRIAQGIVHLLPPNSVANDRSIDLPIWNLAARLAVEQLVSELREILGAKDSESLKEAAIRVRDCKEAEPRRPACQEVV